jgi:phosphate transport system permease protein
VPFARLGILGSIFLALARAWEKPWRHHGDRQRHRHSRFLLSPGYTIAAVIANEFTEATGDIYLSSLVELGLVLFALTMVLNAAGAIADRRHHGERIEASRWTADSNSGATS